MGIFDYFRLKKEEKLFKERERLIKEKEEVLRILIPYKKDILENDDIIYHISGARSHKEIDNNLNFYDGLVKLLKDRDINQCRKNVNQIERIITSRNRTIKEFGKEIGTKINKEKTFKGMNEEMFKNHLKLLIMEGYPAEFILGNNPSTGEKNLMRTEKTLKNGMKKVIYKSTYKIGYDGELEYVFLDDKLV